jgi:hypothetical protein
MREALGFRPAPGTPSAKRSVGTRRAASMQDTLPEGTPRAAQLAPSAVTARAVGVSATRCVVADSLRRRAARRGARAIARRRGAARRRAGRRCQRGVTPKGATAAPSPTGRPRPRRGAQGGGPRRLGWQSSCHTAVAVAGCQLPSCRWAVRVPAVDRQSRSASWHITKSYSTVYCKFNWRLASKVMAVIFHGHSSYLLALLYCAFWIDGVFGWQNFSRTES